MVMSVFAITWLPYNLFVIIALFCADCISSSWWDFGYVFCYINSTVNPILGNKRFRCEFKRTLLL